MSKELRELMNPEISNEPDKFVVIGNRVFVNKVTVRRQFIAGFASENDAIKYATQRNKTTKSAA